MISRTPATRDSQMCDTLLLPPPSSHSRRCERSHFPICGFQRSRSVSKAWRARERERDGTRKGKKEDPKEGQERRRQGCGSIDEGDFRIIRERKATPTD